MSVDVHGCKEKGILPRDARLKLAAAGKVGNSGSLARAVALDNAYAWIETNYPEFIKAE